MSETRAYDDNDLIVNFVDRSRMRRSSTTPAPTTTSTTVKQVSFSEDVRIHQIHCPSREEFSRRWHSERDKNLFKQEMVRDVRDIRSLLSATPMESLEEEVLYFCVGLEAVMSSQVTRYLKKKKRDHSRLTVKVQHHLSDDQLSEYAMISSSQSRERAQQLASGNWKILS